MPRPFQAFYQSTRLWAVAPLAGRDHGSDWKAKRIHCGVDFRGQAAF